MKRALIVVDVQNDFCEGGSLAVTGGGSVAAAISEHIARSGYDAVVATRDFHRDPGAHFSEQPDYTDTWPPHCVIGTPGAAFHPALNLSGVAAVFSKGESSAAYSGFEGSTDDGVRLEPWLHRHGITDVDIVGIATDHCVRATAFDAALEGFRTRVLLDLTAGVAQATVDRALDQLRDVGVDLVGKPVVA